MHQHQLVKSLSHHRTVLQRASLWVDPHPEQNLLDRLEEVSDPKLGQHWGINTGSRCAMILSIRSLRIKTLHKDTRTDTVYDNEYTSFIDIYFYEFS